MIAAAPLPESACADCGARAAVFTGACPRCGGVLLVVERTPPVSTSVVSPLVASRAPGLEGVLLKLETVQPTGSFKDRVMAVLVAQAVTAGYRAAVVASSGNAAVAAAAACARAGLPLLVLVPDGVPASRLAPALLRGAALVRVGDDPSAAHRRAGELAARFPLANLASTFAAPGCEWACRDIGREIGDQAGDGVTHLVAPVSVGPVLVGTAAGMSGTPALWAAQAAGCAPIAEAFAAGARHVAPWAGAVDTRAHAIADRLAGYAAEADLTLRAVRDSGGVAAAVDDHEMARMRADLARYDGLDVELSSCAAPALWRRDGVPGARAVCVLTGGGLKETLGEDPAPADLGAFSAAAGLGDELIEEVRTW
ncbi:pyridoxal-phosphate dependent enzyme [Saccharothrix obliqua]|uniref:pyridoxal-phosphate dependent enzyme n=1 Tax=Saccharothrix obliqua TaxID=2861747 RepID=UPI001C5F27DC|nr:pyridoxal-phosphate dependent enzyme [Saccharothrix obliqua]MBW4721378.1 pyridoxal-phosphate dependent enzyme [Saccharothrix obliqua]